MPIKFSDQLMLLTAKGEEPDDAHEVCRDQETQARSR